MSHIQKKSFGPWALLIIAAIVITGAANGYQLQLSTKKLSSQLDDIVTTVSNQTTQQISINSLYHGQILWNIMNSSKKLDNLIAAHNEMIKAIENATQIHTPIINKITNIHNSYCTLNQVYVPPSCHKHK